MNEFAPPHMPQAPDESDGKDTSPNEVADEKNKFIEITSEAPNTHKIETGKLVLPPAFNEGKNPIDKESDNDNGKMPA